MHHVRFKRAFTIAFGVAVLASCYPAPDAPQKEASLRDVQIPSDFTFATSRAVALTVRATKETTGDKTAAVEVARTDGRILYRGPIRGDRPLSIDLNVPTKDEALTVKLMANGRTKSSNAMIISDMATASF